MNGAESLVRTLVASGVEVCFTNPGTSELHFVAALDKVDGMRARVSEAQFNRLSVRTELQADCFAGVWAHKAQRERGLLEPGDLEEGLGAAAAIGDDRLQRQAGGSVVPDSFTHGSSAQRVRWFRTGFDTGSLKACDTFAARDL